MEIQFMENAGGGYHLRVINQTVAVSGKGMSCFREVPAQ